MKKFTTVIAIVLLLALSLTGCFKEDYAVHTVEGNGYSYEIKSLDYTLSDYLSRGDTIWYAFEDSEGKDTEVDLIFLLEKDGDLYVTPTDLTLGQLTQMEDKDIAALVKEGYQDYMNMKGHEVLVAKTREQVVMYLRQYLLECMVHGSWENFTGQALLEKTDLARNLESISPYALAAAEARIQELEEICGLLENEDALLYLENCLWDMAQYHDLPETLAQSETISPEADRELVAVVKAVWALADDIYEDAMTRFNDGMVEIAPMEYALGIITDSTGNNTAAQMLATKAVKDGEEDYSYFRLEYCYPINTRDGITTNCTMQVYDAIYGGYVSDGLCFYTRVEKNAHFVLDRMGESKLPFDVEPEELFE